MTVFVAETVVVVVAVVDTVAVLVTVVVEAWAVTVRAGFLTGTRLVDETVVVVVFGCLLAECAVTVSVLPTPATSPTTTASATPATNARSVATHGKVRLRGRKSWPHRGQKSEPSGTCAPQFGQVKSPACA